MNYISIPTACLLRFHLDLLKAIDLEAVDIYTIHDTYEQSFYQILTDEEIIQS